MRQTPSSQVTSWNFGWVSLNWQASFGTHCSVTGAILTNADVASNCHFSPSMRQAGGTTTDNTKRNNTPCCYPSVDERQEISKMEAKYPRPEFITRMKPLEASPSKARRRSEGRYLLLQLPKSQKPILYHRRSILWTTRKTNPPQSGSFSTKENEPSLHHPGNKHMTIFEG